MKLWVPVSLVIFLTLSSRASDGRNRGKGGGNTHQTLTVNQRDHTVVIRNYNGQWGWDAIWNYKTGLSATRLFHRRVCVVATMDLEAFPSLEALHSFKEEKAASAQTAKGTSLTHKTRFLIGKTHVQNLTWFGDAIEHLCRGLPTYYAPQEKGANLHMLSPSCTNVGIQNFPPIYLCGNIPNC